jgi:hypothetical protein
MSTTIKNAIGELIKWDTTVEAVTAYRTDLARGITAAKVPYSGVTATSTFTTPLSTAAFSNSTANVVLTAITTAE